ncbi:MAG: hypothetical protein FD133_1208 [Erysipelotrichaceae bacterium]|nr:MAG: hypothetical protein FD179_1627 [Erysipelotrichaceae bacterium]TXT17803.1 MAG: hypothetical protein FD133_1208 [Erysipelotrichaceae bacterium]
MKTLKIILSLLLMGLTLSACSSAKKNDKWETTEMAGIADPGFTIVSKTKTNNEIKFLFKNVEVTKANEFLTALYAAEFKENIYYNYTQSFYTYSASNSSGKSIDFEYNLVEKTASFTYKLSGGSNVVSGVVDMGYYIGVNFEKDMDTDSKNYTSWLYYSINPEVKVTSQSEIVSSCVLKNIKIKTASRVGSLSISSEVYGGSSIVEVNCLNQGFIDPTFIVRQRGIGKFPTNIEYSANQKPYFDAMSVSQGDLNFVVSFTAEIITDKGTYTKAYEISVLPSGSDVTAMKNQVYDVDKRITDVSKGTPYTKS